MKNKGLHTTKKSGFKAPQNYFEAFETNIKTIAHLKNEVPQSGFKTPSNYFDSFTVHFLAPQKEIKVVPLYKKAVLTIGAIAAVLLLFLV